MKLTIAESIVKTLEAAGVNPTCCGQPELSVAGLLVPWITIVGALGFLAAWLVAAILERTGLSRAPGALAGNGRTKAAAGV